MERDVLTELDKTCFHVTFTEEEEGIFPFKFSIYEGHFTEIMDESGVPISLKSKNAPQIIEAAAGTLKAEIEEEASIMALN